MSDENLTELQRDLVEHARKIASEFSLTYWHEKDEAAEYPWEFVRAFADAGYMGQTAERGVALAFGVNASGEARSRLARFVRWLHRPRRGG